MIQEPVRAAAHAARTLGALGAAARRAPEIVETILAVLPAVADDATRLRQAVEGRLQDLLEESNQTTARLDERVARLEGEIARLGGEVKDVAEHLPDPDGSGPIARARNALTGGAESHPSRRERRSGSSTKKS